jgi:hypothetical protein
MPDVFWRQTWRENALMAEAYHNQINLNWEQTRYLATMVYNVNCQKKSQMVKPEDLFPLPSDKKRNPDKGKPKSTQEQFEAFKKKYQSAIPQKTFKL